MATPSAQNNPCRLLSLSAELRNLIYEEVLVQPYTINIENDWEFPVKDRFTQPGLLRTCRQIRSEASSIYYLCNRFEFDVLGYNGTKLIAFCRQQGSYRDNPKVQIFVNLKMSYRTSWSKVISWLQAFCELEAPGFGCTPQDCEVKNQPGGSVCCVISALFDIADELYFESDLAWAQVEAFLEVQKKTMEKRPTVRWS